MPINTEGPLRPQSEAVQQEMLRSPRKFEPTRPDEVLRLARHAIRPETTPQPQRPPEGRHALVTFKGQPDVVIIHSDLEEDPR